MEKRKSGFTLIELLVVITIIALLVSILMPSLNKAKQQATATVCLANLKSLSTAYIMYSDSNGGHIPGGFVARSNQTALIHKAQWVFAPQDENGNPKDIPSATAYATLEDRINGIKRGSLWKYIKKHEVYNCPGDKRMKKPISTNMVNHELNYMIYRSYSIPDCLSGPQSPETYVINPVKMFNRVKTPTEKYCFIEVADPGDGGFNYNHGGWSFNPWGLNRPWDPMAPFHNSSGIFAFMDGHAERHKWEHQNTVDFCESGMYGSNWGVPYSPVEMDATGYPNKDVYWLVRGWASDWAQKMTY